MWRAGQARDDDLHRGSAAGPREPRPLPALARPPASAYTSATRG